MNTGRTLLSACFAILTGVSVTLSSPHAGERVALVIGNADYAHTSELNNPRNDAEGIAAALERFGFEVITAYDADRNAFQTKVRTFGKAVRGADAAVFYYAGHGVQVAGDNFLIPVDARLSDEVDLDFEAVELASILGLMRRADGPRIVFLDACRDNPMARTLARTMGTRSSAVGRGLARVETGTGSLIAFSTAPGRVALDGQGENSPFTAALLDHIETRGIDVSRMMRRVRRDVIEKTNGEQVPWSSSSLTQDFSFAARIDTAHKHQVRPDPAQATKPGVAEAWGSIKDTQSIAVLETFIQNFPDSVYASFAKARLKEIRRDTEEKPESATADSSRRGWLGVRIQNVDKEVASGLGMDRNDPHGALIANIHSPGPAEEAGLEIGDAIIALDGERAENSRDLARKVTAIKPGLPAKLTVLRDGEERTITVKLDKFVEPHNRCLCDPCVPPCGWKK